MYVDTGCGIQGPLATFNLVASGEGISVGTFEVDLINAGLGGIEAGSYKLFLEVGGSLWWPWDPNS